MTPLIVQLIAPDADRFAPFGTFIEPPADPGQRAFFSDHLTAQQAGSAPVFHVNHVAQSVLPADVTRLERHPFSAQIFVPLAVSRYVVLVMPTDSLGAPIMELALGFLVPGTIGVIYHPGVWHAGACVLDTSGHFAVLMWRGGRESDDEFCAIPTLKLTESAISAPHNSALVSGRAAE